MFYFIKSIDIHFEISIKCIHKKKKINNNVAYTSYISKHIISEIHSIIKNPLVPFCHLHFLTLKQ